MENLLIKIKESLRDARPAALCIVTGARGSSPGKTGAKMIVYADGTIEGTVGGGGVEKRVIEDALEIIGSRNPQSKEYNLQRDLGMTCGGEMTVYIEPLTRPARLYIFGAGHIGKMVARYAGEMDFEPCLIDWRKDIFENQEHLPYRKICKPYLEAAGEIAFDRDSYIVIVTPNHEMDEEILATVGKKEVAYIGMIGSKRKIDALTKMFLKDDILTKEELERVDMPIGIRFKAITPAEIAISILARLIDVKNSRNS